MTNKTVRPIMTVEARDALDAFHKTMGMESRSESIIALANIAIDHKSLSRETTRLAGEGFALSIEKGQIRGRLTKAKKEARQWKLIAWSMTAACVALVATMMITAS
ncbi:TMhelix containing protein [Vibrio phage 1.291.O._10N.286.55.F6]|nr:TMhelix containing protein [Vibrio phage 1.291.O._10N.286.55.F6]